MKRKTLSDARKRTTDLDQLIKRIYEDHVLGKLPESRYLKLSGDYENEHQKLIRLSAMLELEIETEVQKVVDIDKFLALAEKYAEISELTVPMVNELISKLVVHNPEKRYSRKHVIIEVFFTYVGKICIPLHRKTAESQSIA